MPFQISKELKRIAQQILRFCFRVAYRHTDDIWKKNINKMKSCTQVWKTRNLAIKGKTLIVKHFLLAPMGFETEIR
jgi:hypothetical protein